MPLSPDPRSYDGGVVQNDCAVCPARSGLRIDFPLAPLPLTMQSLPKIALHQPCAGGIQAKSFPRRIVGTTQRAAMSAQSAAAAQEEYQFKSSTAPGDRGNRRAERSRRVPWGVRGREHHGGRGATRLSPIVFTPRRFFGFFLFAQKETRPNGRNRLIFLIS